MKSLGNAILAQMAALAIVSGGRDFSDPLGMKFEMRPDDDLVVSMARRKERAVQTNAVDPVEPVEAKPSRQVRRQRERLALKSRTDAYHPIRLGRSKYMPHIGKKQRAKGARHVA